MFSRLIGLVVLSAAVVFALPPPHPSPPQQPGRKKLAMTACAAKPDTLQQIFIPLAHLRYFDFGELVLNNNGIDPMVVRPVWFLRGTGATPGRTLTLPPLTMEFHRMDELLPGNVPTARVEGLLIEYDGKLMELGAQGVLRHQSTRASDSLDLNFSMAMDFQSARREATWTAGPQEAATLVIANTAGDQADVQIASSYGSRILKIAPYQAEVVRLEEAATPSQTKAGKQAMWAVIESTSAPGDLRATGFVTGPRSTPRLIRFYDPSAVKQPHLYATRMRVANVTGDLALKNTSAFPIDARAEFLDADSGQPLLELPPVALSPNAARTIDLASVMSSLGANARSEAVAVRVDSNGPTGALIGSLYVHDLTTGTPFDVPLRDSGTARSSTGSYPWRIDDDYQTHVSITNSGPVPARFVARIAYSGGELVFNPRELAAGASATFDLRVLRDEQRNDGTGHVLPSDADHGRFMWTAYGGGQSARLVGRAEVMSVRQGVSSSYSCGQCCQDSFVVSDISPFERTVGVGSSGLYNVVEYRQTCTGQQYQINPWSTSWDVAIPSIASMSTPGYGLGEVAGQSEGTTDVTGHWGVEVWYPFVEDCLVDEWTNDQPARADVQCAVPSNFQQDGNPTDEAGVLHFKYKWQTSIAGGTQWTLAACRVQEYISGYSQRPFPSPPFVANFNPPDPYFPTDINSAFGSQLGLDDYHLVPGQTYGQSSSFVTPYTTANVTVNQKYRWKCPCYQGGAWQDVMGPHVITRAVSQNGNGTWKYTVTKTGWFATVDPLPSGGDLSSAWVWGRVVGSDRTNHGR